MEGHSHNYEYSLQHVCDHDSNEYMNKTTHTATRIYGSGTWTVYVTRTRSGDVSGNATRNSYASINAFRITTVSACND